MTVIETCTVGAVVCVSGERHRLQVPMMLTRGLGPFSPSQIADIIIFTTKPQTNLHFLFALVSFGSFLSTWGQKRTDLFSSCSQPQGRIYT